MHSDTVAASPMMMFTILWRRKTSIVAIGLILSVLAAVVISRLGTAYVSASAVLVQERKSAVVSIQTSGTVATDSVAVRTQADILKSADLARKIVLKLDLVSMPEFSPGPPNALVAGLIDRVRPWDRWKLLKTLGLGEPPTPMTPEQRLELASNILLNATSIVNDGRSYVIEIRVKMVAKGAAEEERAARLSALIANTYAEVYTQFTGRVKSDMIRQVYGFFDERIASLQAKVQKAEQAVQAYRVANDLIENRAASGDGRLVTVANQQLAQLNTDLISASGDWASKEASLRQIESWRAGHGNLLSVPEIVASPLMQRLREQQVELGGKEAALATSRGSGSPDLIAARAAQRDVTAQIALEAGKIAASLVGAAEAAKGREAALRAKVAELQRAVGEEGRTEIHLRELQNEADVAKSVYSTYLQKSAETSEQLDMQEPDALLVSRAGIPQAPAPPSKKALTIFGSGASFVVAAVVALIRERMSTGFRTAAQLEVAVGLETLGYVPRVTNLDRALAFSDPSAPFSEAISSIRALLRLAVRREARVVMVTSAVGAEGKTFFAAALARNAALADERAILVDCSIRRPEVARAIVASGVETTNGITIRRDTNSSLDVVTLVSDKASPPDLFASADMRNLMSLLRSRYELVVMDCPPVLAASDTRVLSQLCDAVVLVVGWRTTPQAVVSQAANVLRAGGADIAGVVINRVSMSQLSRQEIAAAYGVKVS